MRVWAPAVTEADLAATRGFAGNRACGWVLSLDLEVTAKRRGGAWVREAGKRLGRNEKEGKRGQK